MRIVSYLPPMLVPHLVDAISELGADHVQATSWEEVEDGLFQNPRSILVLDPHADRTNQAERIAAILERFPAAPALVYTEFSPAALQALTFLASRRIYETLLFQVDDTRTRFSRLLLRAATHALVVRLLNDLRPRIRHLPPSLAVAVDDLFRRPHAYMSGQDLVIASKVPATSLKRTLADAGLASSKRLFIAARLLHVISYLRDASSTVEQAAEQAGYQQTRILTQHTLAVFDCRPSQLREISDDEAIATFTRWTQLDLEASKGTSVSPEVVEDSAPSC